jgi:hypothetical protein
LDNFKLQKYKPSGILAVIFVVVAISAASVAIVSPFFFGHGGTPGRISADQVIGTHDMAEHIVVMQQFDKVLRSGTLYPRWLPDINKGLGIAWPNFYPPGFYYLTSAVHSIVGNWIDTIYLVTLLLLALSGLAFYKLSCAFSGPLASAIGSILYLLFPYHLLNLYWRGAMPEFAAFALAPLVFYFAYKASDRTSGQHLAGLGLSYAALTMVHLPAAYLLGWVLALYGVLLRVERNDWKPALRVWGGAALGLAGSAIYWLPAAIEARYAYENTTELFPYSASYLPHFWSRDAYGEVLNAGFWAQLLVLAAALGVLFLLTRRAASSADPASPSDVEGGGLTGRMPIRTQAILALATTVMSTFLSTPISILLPKIQVVAFPYRWLMVSGMFTALIASIAAEQLTGGRRLPRFRHVALAVLILIVSLNIGVTIKWVVLRALANARLSIPEQLIEVNYTPRNSVRPDEVPDVDLATLRLGQGSVEVERWDPQYRKVSEQSAIQNVLRFRTYFFPGWKARVDGQDVSLSGDSAGLQMIMVPAGTHTVEVFMTTTPVRILGTALSGLGLAAICALRFGGYLIRRV